MKEVSVYHKKDEFVGLIVSYQNGSDIGRAEGAVVEALFKPVPFVVSFVSSLETGSRIHQIEVKLCDVCVNTYQCAYTSVVCCRVARGRFDSF